MRSVLSRMACECRLGEEGKQEMENVHGLHGLHGLEQSLPKGQFPSTEDRLASILYSQA